MNKWIVETNNASFELDVLKASGPVLVDFWAPWCGPCLSIAPFLDNVASDYAGRLKVVKLNVDEDEKGEANLSKRYNVRGIPTLLIMKDGEIVGRVLGANRSRLQFLIEEHTGSGVAANKAGPSTPALQSFLGDHVRKHDALALLDACRPDHELSVVQTLVNDSARFCDELGLPLPMVPLLNWFEPPLAATLLEAVPVGVDLSAALKNTFIWMLVDETQGMASVLSEVRVKTLFARVVALHLASAGPEAVDAEIWRAARRDALALEEALKGTEFEALTDFVELMSQPFADEAAVDQMRCLLHMIPHLQSLQRQPAMWNQEEDEAFKTLHLARWKRTCEELGELAKESPAAERSEYAARFNARMSELELADRPVDPALWTRKDAWDEVKPSLSRQLNAAVCKQFLVQLKSLAGTQ